MPDTEPALPDQNTRTPRQGDLIQPVPRDRDATEPVKSRKKKTKSGKKAAYKPAGWLAYITLIVLTIACYAPTFSSGLIWSEYDQVQRSPYQSMESWTQAWSMETIRNEDTITLSSYFLEQAIPLDPAVSHHAINLLLHIIAAILLLKVLEGLRLPAAFSAALVFALHPAVLQTIFWSGYRHELVGLILILSALFFGVRNRSARDFFMLIATTAIACLLHPAALLLPLLLGLCIFYQNATTRLNDYNRVLPLLCLALFIGVWTKSSSAGMEYELGEMLSICAQNLYFYIKQGLFPVEVALFYPFEQAQSYNVGAQNSVLPFFLFVPIYILIAINYKQPWARAVVLGLTTYLLVISYGITQTGSFIDGSLAHENHLHYVALPFLVALVICTAGGIVSRIGTGGRFLWYAGFTFFVCFPIAITSSSAYSVSVREQMWYDLSKQWPDAWLPKLALINTIQASGEESTLLTRNATIEMLDSILQKQPDRAEVRQLLARIYRDDGQNTNALREYRRVLRDSTPGNDFLREAADFYDKVDLSWDATNARDRIEN